MAIAIISQPQVEHPIYHPVMWLLDSTLKGNDQFRYQIEIIPEAPAVSRTVEISPRPGDGFGRQDLSQHLKDYLDQDILNIKQTGPTLTQKSARTFYTIKLFEKYKDVSGNIIIVPGLTIVDQVAFNSIFNRNDWLIFLPDQWKLANDTSKLLWHVEDNVEVFKDDLFFVNVLADSAVFDYVLEEHFKNGTSNITTAAATLDKLTNWVRFDLADLLTDPDNAIKFCIKFQQAAVDKSREYCLTLIDGCSRYENLKFIYLDKYGSYNSINFNHISRMSTTAAPKTYKKYIDPLTEDDTSRPITRYFNNPTEVHTANTDYLTDEHNIMMADLINSPRVFLDVRNDPDNPNSKFFPVEILTKTIQEAKSENMDLAQFEILWRFSFDEIGR